MVIGSERVPYRCFAKLFVTWDGTSRMLRCGRLVWSRGNGPGTGKGYSAKLSIALTPAIISWSRGFDEWSLTMLGVRVHFQKAYGGWIA